MKLADWGELLLALSILAVILFPGIYFFFHLGTRISP